MASMSDLPYVQYAVLLVLCQERCACNVPFERSEMFAVFFPLIRPYCLVPMQKEQQTHKAT